MATTTRTEGVPETVRVLVVDPSGTAADFVADALEFADPSLTVETETDPDAAIERVETEPVDFVACEYDLDEGTGIDVLERVREATPEVRGLVHTMCDDPAIAERAWELGFAYAQKGHDVDRYDVIARHIVGIDEDVDL